MISTHRRREHRVFLTAKKHETTRRKNKKLFVFLRVFSCLNLSWVSTIVICLLFLSVADSFAQTKLPTKTPAPKVTQIDSEALKKLLVPSGKPLLVNFWATWCEPCREEFPDLVQISADYKDKIDVITISLDELSEINGDVPKFLAQMKAEMPAYLLKTPDEGAAIAFVSKDWEGGLPFTILFNEKGEPVYSKQGKFKTEVLRAEIEKVSNK